MKASLIAAAALTAVASATPIKSSRGLAAREFSTGNQFDDAGPSVDYTGDWTHLENQGASFFNSTLSYASGQASAYVYLGDNATGFDYISNKKRDRGQIKVSLVSPDGHLSEITTFDQYDANADGQQPTASLFHYDIPASSVAEFLFENVPNDSRIPGGAYIALDEIAFTTSA